MTESSNHTFLGKPISFRPVICVDFDGTLCDHEFPGIGAPKAGAKEALAMFRRLGYHVMIWSCRTSGYFTKEFGYGEEAGTERITARNMVAWLLARGIEFDSVDDGTKGKPWADFYIDDRGIHFADNWSEIAGRILIAAAERGGWDLEAILRHHAATNPHRPEYL